LGRRVKSELGFEDTPMNVKRAITSAITIGDQPSETDLEQLQREGYVAVVNLRNDGEPEQPMSTAQEESKVKALGMHYLHYGVGSAPLAEPHVKEVCDFLDQHSQGPDKVLLHCRKGGRAVALLLIHQARTHDWSAAEVFEKGKAMGLQVDGGLKTLVENYLARK
jgi:uncharacterized protein (TIGR01244 family)